MARNNSTEKRKAPLVTDAILPITSLRKLRILEGLGYTAAVLVGLAALTNWKVFEKLEIIGLVFGIIVIVRLLVFNAALAAGGQDIGPLAEASQDAARTSREEETVQ